MRKSVFLSQDTKALSTNALLDLREINLEETVQIFEFLKIMMKCSPLFEILVFFLIIYSIRSVTIDIYFNKSKTCDILVDQGEQTDFLISNISLISGDFQFISRIEISLFLIACGSYRN